jgi:hypothetical protein
MHQEKFTILQGVLNWPTWHGFEPGRIRMYCSAEKLPRLSLSAKDGSFQLQCCILSTELLGEGSGLHRNEKANPQTESRNLHTPPHPSPGFVNPV